MVKKCECNVGARIYVGWIL